MGGFITTDRMTTNPFFVVNLMEPGNCHYVIPSDKVAIRKKEWLSIVVAGPGEENARRTACINIHLGPKDDILRHLCQASEVRAGECLYHSSHMNTEGVPYVYKGQLVDNELFIWLLSATKEHKHWFHFSVLLPAAKDT